MNNIRELIDLLNKYTKAYNEGNPKVSDKEWDDLYFKLVNMEEKTGIIYPDSPTQSIIYDDVDVLKKVKHNHLMLSLDKTKDIDVLKNFIGDKDVVIMGKCDGLTCSLKYIDGKLVSAETRGNGIEGEDITHNIKCVKYVPIEIPLIKGELVVDGEIICDLKTFEDNFKNEYKNARNYAAGAVRRLHSSENKDCGLSFVAWDVPIWKEREKVKIETLNAKLSYLNKFGFNSVPRIGNRILKEDLGEYIEYIKNKCQDKDIPIDGIVIKYNECDYYDSLGHTDHHFRGGIAYKFYDEEYKTRLKDINYDVSRNGVLTPVAVFEPIEIDGTIVERASLHNISIMEEILGDTPYFGETIWVYKANQIIPQIARADIRNYGDIVSHGGCTVGLGGDYGVICPICGGFTSIIKSESGVKTLVCDNENCPGKLAQRIDHYCSKKGLDIKGLSRKTIEKLIDWGWVNELGDIYGLDRYKDKWMAKPGFGQASVGKILLSINASKTRVSLDSFISAIGIPLVGRTIAKEITKYYETWDDFRSAVGGDWTIFNGFGIEINEEINNFDYSEADKIAAMLDFKTPEVQENISQAVPAIKDKVFCITGKLKSFKNRDELKADIISLGGKVTDSVSSKTDYLINNDLTSTSSKNKKAKELNIPIISEEDYIDLKSE